MKHSVILSRRPEIVVEVKGVAPEHADRVDSLIAAFAEPYPLPVFAVDGARRYAFRFQPGRDEAFHGVASPAHSCGALTIYAQDDFLPADASVKRHDLAPLTQADAARLKGDFEAFLSDITPATARAEWKAPPLRTGSPLLYGSGFGQYVIHAKGFMPATSSGEVPRSNGVNFSADTDEARASSPMCVAVAARERSLVVVSLDWSVNEAAAAAYAAAGVAPHGAETAAAIEAAIARHAGSGLIATKREDTRATLVFANADRSPFSEQYDVRKWPKRGGVELPYSSVRISCRTEGAPLDISAADAFSVDFTVTKYAELASLSGVKFTGALSEIDAHLQNFPAQTEEAPPARRGRKTAA